MSTKALEAKKKPKLLPKWLFLALFPVVIKVLSLRPVKGPFF